MKGCSPGAPHAIGETPRSFERPPQAGSAGDELVKTRLSMLASMACWQSQADMPKWLECLIETMPMPYVLAISMALAMPIFEEMAPKAFLPSTWATTGEISVTTGCALGSVSPLRARVMYDGRRLIPWVSTPRRSAATRQSATVAASSDARPLPSKTLMAKARALGCDILPLRCGVGSCGVCILL